MGQEVGVPVILGQTHNTETDHCHGPVLLPQRQLSLFHLRPRQSTQNPFWLSVFSLLWFLGWRMGVQMTPVFLRHKQELDIKDKTS